MAESLADQLRAMEWDEPKESRAEALRRAADLIEKLPVTADGVYVVPGMTLYRPWYVGDANWSSMPASDGWNVASGEVGQMELSPILGTNDPSQCYAHSENAEKGGA